MDNKKHYTYIILTQNDTLYCGYTDDVQKRYKAHIDGHGAKYTRAFKPKELVFVKEFETKSEALKEEIRIKTLKKAQKIELINSPQNEINKWSEMEIYQIQNKKED